MEFILQQERIAHETFDVYNHLAPHQERALYQCFDSELERPVNVISGDFNSGKRLVLSWLVKSRGGATLIAVNSKIELLKWKHHFSAWTERVDYLPMWRKRTCAKRARRLSIVWYRRLIVDVGARQPRRCVFEYCWTIDRGAGGVTLPSPFSLSLFRVYPHDNVMLSDWKVRARAEHSFARLYSMLAFVRAKDSPPKQEEEEEDDCPICREKSTNRFVTECGHAFCPGCIFSSFLYAPHFKCPMCRQDLQDGAFTWRGKQSLEDAVVDDFQLFSGPNEHAVVYDPHNRFQNLPLARLGGLRVKVCRVVKIPKLSSVPLPHATHLFSTVPVEHIASTLLKKYFSGFDRKNILKIFYFGN